MSTGASAAADALRNHLRDILSELDEEIRTAFPVSCGELERKICVAEITTVKELVDFIKEVLVGTTPPPSTRCLAAGQACDLQDSLLICARDVRIEREKREAALAQLKKHPWRRDVGEAFQQLIDDEQRVCEHLMRESKIELQRAAALRTVTGDVSDVCLKALMEAQELPAGSEQQRTQVGAEAMRRVELAASQWLTWTETSAERKDAHWATCPRVLIPSLLSETATTDRKASDFLSALRVAMRLRRQQVRLLAIQQRLAAVLVAQEILASLRARILLPATTLE